MKMKNLKRMVALLLVSMPLKVIARNGYTVVTIKGEGEIVRSRDFPETNLSITSYKETAFIRCILTENCRSEPSYFTYIHWFAYEG